MDNNIFAFTLYTESDLSGAVLFSETGEVIGRILRKSPPCKDSAGFSYDVESSKQIFEQLKNSTVKLYGVDAYSLSDCNTWYKRSDK